MPRITSLLKSICGKVMGIIFRPLRITKKMYRQMALLTVGGAIVSAVAFTSNGFAGSGKNAVTPTVVRSGEEGLEDDDLKQEAVSILEIAGLETSTVEEGESLLEELIKDTKSAAIDFQVLSIQTGAAGGSDETNENTLKDLKTEDEGAYNYKEDLKSTETDESSETKAELVKIVQEESGRERMERLLEERRVALGFSSLTIDDYNNLLRIVEAEVGDNDVYGRTIVANVILNRVRSERFPDTITEVIFSPKQFSPIRDKRFFKVKVSEATIKGVNNALLGEDNSGGALYFMDRDYSSHRSVSWFDSSLQYLFSYGGHEYFK